MKGKATVYKAQVLSIMEYVCLSLMTGSDSVLVQLDAIQRKALRILGVDEAAAAIYLPRRVCRRMQGGARGCVAQTPQKTDKNREKRRKKKLPQGR